MRKFFSLSSEEFPGVLLSLSLVLTILIVSWIGLQFFSNYQKLQTILAQSLRISELKGRIIYLDEVLTMSAHMASATGDGMWEERYKSQEDSLDMAIRDIISLAPNELLKNVAKETDRANKELVKIEYEAFRLVKAGKQPQAEKFLLSSSYNEQKKIYSQGMEKYMTLLATYIQQDIEATKHKLYQLLVLVAIAFVLLVGVWFFTLRSIYKWRRTLEQARLQVQVVNGSLQQALREIEHKNTELESFAHIASHDLQEPLRTIFSFIQLLEQSTEKYMDAEMRSYFHHIEVGVNRMRLLVSNLLMYAKISDPSKSFQHVNCSELVLQTLTALQIPIKEANMQVSYGELPSIYGEPTQMMQLFQNIISNAIKYSSKSVTPQLDIMATLQEQEWLFIFKDNGIGIDKESIENIFVPFVRLHGLREYPGTGMGLAICRKIVENHGGRIWASSQPGEGAVFYFTIPK